MERAGHPNVGDDYWDKWEYPYERELNGFGFQGRATEFSDKRTMA
jgi:hypothetical protein